MSAPIRLYMSMSLDGFIAGPDDRPGQELGHGGGRLFNLGGISTQCRCKLYPGPRRASRSNLDHAGTRSAHDRGSPRSEPLRLAHSAEFTRPESWPHLAPGPQPRTHATRANKTVSRQ